MSLLPAVLLAAAFQPCPDPPLYWFKIERLGRGVVARLAVRVETAGNDLTTDSGLARILVPGKCPGDKVGFEIVQSGYRVLYPPAGRVTLTTEEPALVVVFVPAEDDAQLKDQKLMKETVNRLMQEMVRRTENLQAIQEAVNHIAASVDQLPEILRMKEQVEASRKATTLLTRYHDRAVELTTAFTRHTENAMSYPVPGPLDQLIAAIGGYNGARREVVEDGEALRVQLSAAFGAAAADDFARLRGEALAIHQYLWTDLNEAKELMNKIYQRVLDKAQVPAAKEEVRSTVRRTVARAEKDLARLAESASAFAASLRGRLAAPAP